MRDVKDCKKHRVRLVKQGKKDYFECSLCGLRVEGRKMFHLFFDFVMAFRKGWLNEALLKQVMAFWKMDKGF